MKERQEAIKRYIERKGDVTLSELTKEFSDWSEMTIRRDLEFLEQRRFLIRTKRGARIMPTSYEVSVGMYGEREKRNCDLKQEIAAKAAALVETDISMYLDAGSTAMMLARELPTATSSSPRPRRTSGSRSSSRKRTRRSSCLAARSSAKQSRRAGSTCWTSSKR